MKRLFTIIILLCLVPIANGEEKIFDLGNGLMMLLEEKAFVATDWDIEYCPGSESICRINGKVPFGVDGNLPNQYLDKIEITNGNQLYHLDTSNMFDAWGDRPLDDGDTVKYFSGTCHNPEWCLFRGLFSDGAGSFVAEWQVRAGIAERTIITDSKDIVHLFISNIGPPVY